MDKIVRWEDLWRQRHIFENKDFLKRYLCYKDVEKTLQNLSSNFDVKQEGKSVNGISIASVCFGSGPIKILMWSQMHGNETTTTKAVLDMLQTFSLADGHPFLNEILKKCTIKLVPVLNPDGAASYTRENKNKVDLNRDAIALSQPESRLLHSIFIDFQPNFCFNLHDQRSIYGVGNTKKPAIVSFLAPSINKEKEINETRKTAMKLIVQVNKVLQQFIPNQIGRYDDAFNPNCVGDKFQSFQVPTLLFEAGHFPDDYQRNKTRGLIFLGLFVAMHAISTENYFNQNQRDYFDILENKKSFFDLIIRNVTVNKVVMDVAIQYEERLKENSVVFIPVVEKLGDLSAFFGHKTLNFQKEELRINHCSIINKKTEIENISVGNGIITTDLTNN